MQSPKKVTANIVPEVIDTPLHVFIFVAQDLFIAPATKNVFLKVTNVITITTVVILKMNYRVTKIAGINTLHGMKEDCHGGPEREMQDT